MLAEQVMVLSYIPVVEVGDPKIKQNVEKKWKIENDKVKTESLYSYKVLHGPVNTKYPERLDKQIQE